MHMVCLSTLVIEQKINPSATVCERGNRNFILWRYEKISAVASGLDRLLSDFQTIVDLSEQYVAASYTRKLLFQKINVWTFIDSFSFKNCFIVINLEAVTVDTPKKN